MLQKLSFVGFLMIIAMSIGIHGVAKAQSSNVVSYRCDLKQDQIVVTYNDALKGDQLGVNSWNMDSLWGPGSDEDLRVRKPVTQTCRLSSGTYEVEINPNGTANIQGMCGGDPSTGTVDISVNGNFLLNTDFNDLQCGSNAKNEMIDKIVIHGKTKEISISYGDGGS
jgi:hypothetical protein